MCVWLARARQSGYLGLLSQLGLFSMPLPPSLQWLGNIASSLAFGLDTKHLVEVLGGTDWVYMSVID